jgi:hypothetical protein
VVTVVTGVTRVTAVTVLTAPLRLDAIMRLRKAKQAAPREARARTRTGARRQRRDSAALGVEAQCSLIVNRFAPCAENPLYSITSSTCASKIGESDSPSACAVLLFDPWRLSSTHVQGAPKPSMRRRGRQLRRPILPSVRVGFAVAVGRVGLSDRMPAAPKSALSLSELSIRCCQMEERRPSYDSIAQAAGSGPLCSP